MAVHPVDPPVFAYTVLPMPPSPIGRRWRWQLFLGERLLAGGWQFSERGALRSLRTAASRAVHQLAGVLALRPDLTHVDGAFVPGGRVVVECGALACVLAPRADELSAAA